MYDIKQRGPNCTLEGPCYKTLPDGRKVQFKARLVILGYQMIEGKHYHADQTYAPTPQTASVRLSIALAFQKEWDTIGADVSQAFVQAKMPVDQQFPIKLPKSAESAGFSAENLYLLVRSLYGCVQASHLWYKEIRGTLENNGYTCIICDQGVYARYDKDGNLTCLLILHVDDFYISGPDQLINGLMKQLKKTYTISGAPTDWFLKIQINKSEDGKLLSMAQPMYAEDIVKAMGLDVVNSNSARTPIDAALSKGEEIPLTEEEEEFMADKYEQYGHVVGMLGALALTTRPDLAYAVGQVRQYTAFPRRHHYQALKRIVRYVKGTIHYGIVFSKDASSKITGYVDADHATNKDDRTSISGTVFLFMGAAIVYRSKKQKGSIMGELRDGEKEEDRKKKVTADAARSTAESELRALDLGTRDALWLRKMAEAFRMPDGETAIPIYEDNQSCYYIAKNNKWTSATKHVANMYFAVRDDIVDERIDLRPVDTKDNLADMFTKALRPVCFERFRLAIGVRDASV